MDNIVNRFWKRKAQDAMEDINWLTLSERYDDYVAKGFSEDPAVQQLGAALEESLQTGDMSAIQPFVEKFIWAKPRK